MKSYSFFFSMFVNVLLWQHKGKERNEPLTWKERSRFSWTKQTTIEYIVSTDIDPNIVLVSKPLKSIKEDRKLLILKQILPKTAFFVKLWIIYWYFSYMYNELIFIIKYKYNLLYENGAHSPVLFTFIWRRSFRLFFQANKCERNRVVSSIFVEKVFIFNIASPVRHSNYIIANVSFAEYVYNTNIIRPCYLNS